MAAGCSTGTSDPSKTSSASSANPASEADSKTASVSAAPKPASPVDEAQKEGYQTFSWDLFKKSIGEKETGQISPLSAFYALGMLAGGAKEKTLEQLENALHLKDEDINSLAYALLAGTADKKELALANSLWLTDGMKDAVLPDYTDLLKKDYEAEVFVQPFDDKAVADMNAWVEKKTDGMIKKMVSSLDSSVVMVLINALAFSAEWQTPYKEEAIAAAPFANADGSKTDVDLMHSDEDLYIEAEGLKGFVKPYKDERYALAALLPADEKQTLDEVLAKADGSALLKAIAAPQSESVSTALPKFELSSEIPLNKILQEMGITDAFEGSADFSGMAKGGGLAVSEVLQKNKIQVDDKGTKAAAATDAMIMETAMLEEDEKKSVICDRPFLYVLFDLNNGLPLMIGTYQNASDQTSES